MRARLTGRSLVVAAVAVVSGCEARNLVPDAGGVGGAGGAGGAGEIDHHQWYDPALSDFEDPARATVLKISPPGRNGYWYAYDDASPTCVQGPAASTYPYVPEFPPSPSPGSSGDLALQASWSGCTSWGAGVGADLNVPEVPGTVYGGPKSPADLTWFVGVTFWAMAAPGTDGQLRFEMPMRGETRYEDGGLCNEADVGVGHCGDHYGELFALPADGSWTRVTIRFADAGFRQEGWGHTFQWSSGDVTTIQIRSVDLGETYDFWIDDVSLIPWGL